MRFLKRVRWGRTIRRRLRAAVVCIAYLLAALELPLPASVHKGSEQSFPCQNHACGCQTAEQCWRNCCCFTPEQRWSWARENHVEPPEYAEKPPPEPVATTPAADAGGWNTVKLRDREREAIPSTQSCCSRPSKCCSSPAEPPQSSASSTKNGIRWGSTLAAQRCRGYATLWNSIGAVLPIPPRATWNPHEIPFCFVPFQDESANRVTEPPSDPPPRLSFV